MRRWLIAALVALVSMGARPVAAMGFCSPANPSTMREDMAEAQVVMYGTIANPRVETDANERIELTDFHLKRVIKKGPFVGGTKVLQLHHYIAVDPEKNGFLIFCDINNGKLVPFRGVVVASSAVIDYLQEMTTIDPTDRLSLLTHSFRYPDHADPTIADDAFLEFRRAVDGKDDEAGGDYRPLAGRLSADRIADLLSEPQTRPWKQGLYAQLLGHCGKAEHAQLLRCMLELADGQDSASGRKGLLVGFTLLQAREGWAYIDALLGDSSRTFTERYMALRIVRFFWEKRPDVVGRQTLLKGVSRLLEQSDIADLLIEELRKWGQFQMADEVMALKDKPSHNTIPIMRRALLRFALSCPKNAAAAEYVEQMVREHPDEVENVEEQLRWEKDGK
jgi:hypothetical protein